MPPFHRPRARRICVCFLIGSILFGSGAGHAQQPKKRGKKKSETSASPSSTPEAGGQVPLPIGHEAKGLVLPDIDAAGHMRARFNAGTAKRVDADHMEFHDLHIITYNDDGKIDLNIAMADSMLDLNTHVLSSPQRTTIKRSDFEIAGDRARFDTAQRHGTLSGNVKMVLTNAQKYTENQSQ